MSVEMECQGCLYTLCGFLCLTEDLSEILQFLWRHGCLRKNYFCEKCGRKCAIGDKDLFFRCNRTCIENTAQPNNPFQQSYSSRQLQPSIGQSEIVNTIGRHENDIYKTNVDTTTMTDHLLMLETHNPRRENADEYLSHLDNGDRTEQVLTLVNNNRHCETSVVRVTNIDDRDRDDDEDVRILTQLGVDNVHCILRHDNTSAVSRNSAEGDEGPPTKNKRVGGSGDEVGSGAVTRPVGKKRCNFKVSMKKGTFFEKSKLPIDTVCKFVMFWCCLKNPTQEFLRTELSLATRTVVDWSNCCRDICIHWAKSVSEKIGGDGVVIQVDEVKINENKSQEALNKFSFWGMEKDKERGKIFIVPVPACDSWSLLTVVDEWVQPGSVVISNCWKTYDCLKEQEFIQQTIVHSKTFVHPQNHVGQHNYEYKSEESGGSTSGDLHMPRFGTRRSHHLGDLAEFMFKRRFSNHLERIHAFFRQISMAYPLR